mmetsp:Transcript_46370/g.88529  ORF Transcript_46370/g.88529 Transcript_46370/m.88529 type:complete len:359 (-) Transcript_46370:52-1128(-)
MLVPRGQLRGGQVQQLLQGGGVLVVHEGCCHARAGARVLDAPELARARARLHDHRLEQACGARGGVERARRDAARALAHQRHLIRVPSEVGDVRLHPLQRHQDVIVAVHAARARLAVVPTAQIAQHQKAQGPQAIVQRDHHGLHVGCHVVPPVAPQRREPAPQPASVHKHNHREGGGGGRGEDVEVEAVFIHQQRRREQGRARGRLHARRRKRPRRPHALPRLVGQPRRVEAVPAHGHQSRVRHASEHVDGGVRAVGQPAPLAVAFVGAQGGAHEDGAESVRVALQQVEPCVQRADGQGERGGQSCGARHHRARASVYVGGRDFRVWAKERHPLVLVPHFSHCEGCIRVYSGCALIFC